MSLIQFPKIVPKDAAQAHVQPVANCREVPADVADLIHEILLVELTPVEPVLLEQVGRLAGQSKAAVHETLVLVESPVVGPAGHVLVLVDADAMVVPQVPVGSGCSECTISVMIGAEGAETVALPEGQEDGRVHELSREEARALFDREARHYLNISGDEFIRAWDAGEFDEDVERSEVIHVALLLPLGR